MRMDKVTCLHEGKRYVTILFGALIVGLAMNLFIIPAKLLSNGVSGIAIILYYIAGWPVGTQLLLYNLPILYLAYRYLGRRYAIDTVYGTVVFSLAIDATTFLDAYHPVHDLMLCAIFGGVISGMGYGIIFRAGSNTGGMDVIGAIVKKYWSVDVGTAVFGLNMLVIMASAALFNLEIALFTMVSIYATAELTNRFAAGFNREKAIMIISNRSERIGESIMIHLHRGVTYLNGRGGFLKEEKSVVYVVVSLTQVGMVKTLVDKADPNAFMIVMSASEVMGRGFSQDSILYKFALRRALIREREKEHAQEQIKEALHRKRE